MSSLSLSPEVKVFPCPNCSQTINTSMRTCPFCSAPIDANAAAQSAIATSKISQACSDASYLKVMAWAILSFFLLTFVPFLGLIGVVGLWFLRIAIPVMVIRWWIKFGSIKTDDPDFVRAKRQAIVVGVLSLFALASALPIHLGR